MHILPASHCLVYSVARITYIKRSLAVCFILMHACLQVYKGVVTVITVNLHYGVYQLFPQA